jgi:hypothetical protein
MKIIKKTISLLLILSAVFISLVSCGKIEKNEALAKANELLENAYILNIVCYGDGMEFHDDGNSSTVYAGISETAPYQTSGELESAIDSAFSKSFASAMKEICFSGQTGIISSTLNYARYSYYGDEGFLKVYKYIEGIEVRKPDVSKTEILKIKNKEIKGVITYENGETQEFFMVKENGEWKLDSPTY